jgi:Tfp pilus assembly protein PilF
MPIREVSVRATGSDVMQIRLAELIRRTTIRSGAALTALAVFFVLLSGCAATVKGPTVERLPDGSRGFIIREHPEMDDAPRADFERAVALLADGKNEQAIELLAKVIYRAPGFTGPHIDIALAYMRTGKLELAEQHLKAALKLVPGHPVASNEYGLLLRKAGRFQEAREIYERAIDRFPDYLPVHRNLGILCDIYLNDPACALRQFEIYSEGKPADARVKTWIAELRIRLGKN